MAEITAERLSVVHYLRLLITSVDVSVCSEAKVALSGHFLLILGRDQQITFGAAVNDSSISVFFQVFA